MAASSNPTQTTALSAVAHRRILRLATGTALTMAFSQLVNWPLSFMAAVFAMLILSLPLPKFTIKMGLKFFLALVIPAYSGMLLLPFLTYSRGAGFLLVVLALFGSFYFSARGGSPILGLLMTISITLVVTIGSVNADAMLLVVNAIAVAAFVGFAFNVAMYAWMPDIQLPTAPVAPQSPVPVPAPKPTAAQARSNAMRSMLVVLPIVVILLFINSSFSYVPVMIKVASMGQQANVQDSRSMGWQQLESTFWGGLGAVIIWYIMGIWPSLLIFSLLIALACLIYGTRIFEGGGLHPKSSMWSYALLTMVVVITPSVMDSAAGGDASSSFYSRLLIFAFIAVYGTVAVLVFDTFKRPGGMEMTATGLPEQRSQ
jgi:hypothetical protein